MDLLAAEFAPLGFRSVFVYTREAHPAEHLRHHASFAQKLALARQFRAEQAVQREIHEGFIDLVKQSRGSRLNGEDTTLFSGEYWTGTKAIALGLADAIGDLRSTLRERFGSDVATPLISAPRGWLGRPQPGVLRLLQPEGTAAEELISALEARALWSRYGL